MDIFANWTNDAHKYGYYTYIARRLYILINKQNQCFDDISQLTTKCCDYCLHMGRVCHSDVVF